MANRGDFRLPTLPAASVALAIILTLGLLLQTPLAQTKPATVPPDQCRVLPFADLAASADLIVTGHVFAVLPGDPYAQVLITPDRTLKGSVPEHGITIVANANPTGTSSESSDLNFTSNDPPYLLLLHTRNDGTFTTSACAGSRLLGSGLTTEESAALND